MTKPKSVLSVDLDDIKTNECVITGWEDRIKQSKLTQEDGEWVLKSKDDSRILRRYGKNKPSEEAITDDEQEINYFKHENDNND